MIDTVLRRALIDPSLVQPRRSRNRGVWRLGIAFADAVQVPLTGLVLASTRVMEPAFGSLGDVAGLGVLGAVLALLIRRSLRPIWPRAWLPRALPAVNAAGAVLLAFLLISLTLSLSHTGDSDLNGAMAWLAAWAVASALCSGALRVSLTPIGGAARGRGHRIVVIGPEDQASALVRLVAGSSQDEQIVATLRHDRPQSLLQVEQLIAEHAVDTVLLTGMDAAAMQRVCQRLEDYPVDICIGCDAKLLEATAVGTPRLDRLPLVPLLPNPADDWPYVCKRVIDVSLILLSLPLIAPVLLLAALAIKLESPGPVLFRQWRFGLSSRPTQIFKFRTMYHGRGDLSGEQRTLAQDPRVTRVGRILRRTSIDELPQLLNVLRGDMALVGPRPHATHMKVEGNYYFEAVERYRLRHRVLPGLTGWAQVNGSRGEVDTLDKARRRLDLDLWYINNWSLALDFRITLRTLLGGFLTFRAD